MALPKPNRRTAYDSILQPGDSVPELTLHDYVEEDYGDGWERIFGGSGRDNLHWIADRIEENGSYLPHPKDVFRPFRMTTPENIKVVLIGQDPYPGTDPNGFSLANGLAFATDSPYPVGTKCCQSLNRMFQELERSMGPITGFRAPRTGNLDKWLYNGVFLFNTTPTKPVIKHKKNPHATLWKRFREDVLHLIFSQSREIIVIALGDPAQKLVKSIVLKPDGGTNYKNVYVIEATHPSPMAANARVKFIGSDCFKKAYQRLNDFDWNL